MLTLFLIGLVAVIATIVVTAILILGGKWLVNWAKEKIKNRNRHKAVFADTKEVVDDYLKNRADNSDEISMEELERMCEETPYVGAVVDEDGEISEYEGFTAAECNENFAARMKQQKGMVIVGD